MPSATGWNSSKRPTVARHRSIDGDYILRITCWHRRTGELAHPDRDTAANWEFYALLNPCRYVAACPRFDWLNDHHSRTAELDDLLAAHGFIDMTPPWRRSAAFERSRRRNPRNQPPDTV